MVQDSVNSAFYNKAKHHSFSVQTGAQQTSQSIIIYILAVSTSPLAGRNFALEFSRPLRASECFALEFSRALRASVRNWHSPGGAK